MLRTRLTDAEYAERQRVVEPPGQDDIEPVDNDQPDTR